MARQAARAKRTRLRSRRGSLGAASLHWQKRAEPHIAAGAFVLCHHMSSSTVPKTETELRAECSSMHAFAVAMDALRTTFAPTGPDRIAHLPTPGPDTDDDDDEDEESDRGSGGGNIDPDEDEEEPLQTSGGRSSALPIRIRE